MEASTTVEDPIEALQGLFIELAAAMFNAIGVIQRDAAVSEPEAMLAVSQSLAEQISAKAAAIDVLCERVAGEQQPSSMGAVAGDEALRRIVDEHLSHLIATRRARLKAHEVLLGTLQRAFCHLSDGMIVSPALLDKSPDDVALP